MESSVKMEDVEAGNGSKKSFVDQKVRPSVTVTDEISGPSGTQKHNTYVPKKNIFLRTFHRPRLLRRLLNMRPPPYQVQLHHAWNPGDRSCNITMKYSHKLSFHRKVVPNSTDAIRGKFGYTQGIHCWEICWPKNQRGTHAVVGVATLDAPLHCVGYQCLVGSTEASWGWDLPSLKLHHNSKNESHVKYPIFLKDDEPFTVPDRFLVILDMEGGTLGFAINDLYLGIAFSGLRGNVLYPIVSSVYGNCFVTVIYRGGLFRSAKFSKHLLTISEETLKTDQENC